MQTIQIVGRKDAGKTGLVVRLIPLLQAHGLRVGSVKHTSHPHLLDREGSDSYLHRRAGAEATMAITAAAVSFHFPAPEAEVDVGALIGQYMGELDLVLIEGWAARNDSKIEVLPADKAGNPREPRALETGDLLAAVLAPGLGPMPESVSPWGELQEIGALPSPIDTKGAPGSRKLIPCFLWEDAVGVARLIRNWLGR